MAGPATHPFDAMVARGEGNFRLAEAALLFAADHARVNVALSLRRLDGLAQRVGTRGASNADDQLQAMRGVLVVEEQLRGATNDYYDPRNSFLNEVLERRVGIPISLSVVWIDIARQLGWPFQGVGLPGHFMVRQVRGPGALVMIDAFAGGRAMTRHQCEELVGRIAGAGVQLDDTLFAAATDLSILSRMLNNLAAVYTRRQEWPRLTQVLLRQRALAPDDEQLDDQIRWAAAQCGLLN
jgi:regulator of sirC expression with transglutaminase-like and TPR domain